jgi:hypothetical protein
VFISVHRWLILLESAHAETKSLSENSERSCGEGKARPKGFRGKSRLALLLLGCSPLWGCALVAPRQPASSAKNMTARNFQKGSKMLFLCLGAGLVLTAVLWAVLRDREPTYDGRTLSEWVDLSGKGVGGAAKAIRRMGTNTFPVVLKWLRSEPAPWKAKWLRRVSVGPVWARQGYLVNWLDDVPARTRSGRAHHVIVILQEEAAPIAPDLLKLSYGKSEFVANRALGALGYMRTKGLPNLLRAVRDPNHPHREYAVQQVGMVLQRNPTSTNAVQALLECTADKDAGLQVQASVALAYWASRQPAGAVNDEFKRSVGNTNQWFLSATAWVEQRASRGITNYPAGP